MGAHKVQGKLEILCCTVRNGLFCVQKLWVLSIPERLPKRSQLGFLGQVYCLRLGYRYFLKPQLLPRYGLR